MRLAYSGNKALITGGSCDIALSLARLMAEAGIFPVLSYRNEEGHKKITSHLQSIEGRYHTCFMDFSDPESLDPAMESMSGGLDYLIDFAQGDFESLVASADNSSVAGYFDSSVTFRAMLLKKAARLMMRNQSGRMIFISSTAAGTPNIGQGFYAASKLASEALYRNMGIELGKKGITAVSLRPGYVESGRGERFLKNTNEEVLRKIPAGRFLNPLEVSESIMFFLSDSAKGFNATELVLDGGLTSCK